MPPKSKRKAAEPDDADHDPASDVEDGDKPAKKPKKAPAAKAPVVPLDPSLPTNITFPIEIKLPAKATGTTRLSCWNGARRGSPTSLEVDSRFACSLRHRLLR